MKRKFAFFLLFSALFTFSAAAEEVNYAQFGDAQEASREGYRNGMYDKYEQYSNELSKPDSDLRIQIIEFFCENFESGMDPEEYDREMIKQSYDWGYEFGVRDYTLIEHTLDRSQETLYNRGYEDGAYDKYDEIINNTDYTSSVPPAAAQGGEIETISSASLQNICLAGIICAIVAAVFAYKYAKEKQNYERLTKAFYKLQNQNYELQKEHNQPEQPPKPTPPAPEQATQTLDAAPIQPKTPEAWLLSKYLTADEMQLPYTERYQRALDNYMRRQKSLWEVGLEYERQIGYEYETGGAAVEYVGAVSGRSDMGCDLLVKASNEIKVVQCKRYSQDKPVYEKHILQLHGTTEIYRTKYPFVPVRGLLITTTYLTRSAHECADRLGIDVREHYPFTPHPLIKCIHFYKSKNFFLPFDPRYDRIQYDSKAGDKYVETVAEAIDAGFERM